MSSMPEVTTHNDLLRTRVRLDSSGLLFIACDDPSFMLTLKADSPTWLEDLTCAIRAAYQAQERALDDLEFITVENGEMLWSISAPEFVRTLQVA